MRGRVGVAAALLLAAFGLWQLAAGLWIPAKAALAQALIRGAWAAAESEAAPVRPWPWADTHAVARLRVPRLGIDRILLAGASGRTLAFGPGHREGTPVPGAPGMSVVTGHRDTHFAFLRRLEAGDEIRVVPRGGGETVFTVVETAVVDAERSGLATDVAAPHLALVTCWPFDAVVPGGTGRYVVVARAGR